MPECRRGGTDVNGDPLGQAQHLIGQVSKHVLGALDGGRRALGRQLDAFAGIVPKTTAHLAELTRLTNAAGRFASMAMNARNSDDDTAGRLSEQEMVKLESEFLKLPVEEQKAIVDYATLKFLENKKIKYKGRSTSLKKLTEQYFEEEKVWERGGNRDTMTEDEENFQYLDAMPANEIRKEAPKQQLRPEEEQALELECMAQGEYNQGFWGGRQYTFGLFARPQQVKEVLEKKWSQRLPHAVMNNPEYWNDILMNAHNMELTLMVVPSKRLSIPQYQRRYGELLRKGLEQEGPSKQDRRELNRLVTMFDPSILRGRLPWVSGSRILPDTQMIFSTLPKGELAIEVINPAPLKDQHPTFMGILKSPKLTYSVFDMFLGNSPIDAQARQEAGTAMLYLANGFKMEYDPLNPYHKVVGEPPRFDVEEVDRRAIQFSIDPRSKKGRMLLGDGSPRAS
ncbi:unnamed protein product [Ostreobium quekettii]|uniref:Uncharacterized protein n=1 Tax=Ostreobium quekettii TaxID=121088 RepID=A0A8S1IWL7_9CHLO|nr:unnamed protein product [Ostreobium quekettii]|eukprot:evm.model.scf_813.2 EVM.evm.TU.scf_813.2   scf_813:7624-11409(+)